MARKQKQVEEPKPEENNQPKEKIWEGPGNKFFGMTIVKPGDLIPNYKPFDPEQR